MASGIDLIKAERQRQIEAEGYTPEHDDRHESGELSDAAGYYARDGHRWPFDTEPKRVSRTRDMVRAGALYLAEADRASRLLQQYVRMDVCDTEWLDARVMRAAGCFIDAHKKARECAKWLDANCTTCPAPSDR